MSIGLPAAGAVIDGKLEVVGVLGAGGMGAVLSARHLRTGRSVAVKVLRPDIASDPDAVQRLLQEALACGRIQHPNVVDVSDAGVHDGAPYVVMELLRGESAAARLDRRGALPVDEAVWIVLEATRGVAAAHAQGIVHRDLKPDNLFVATPISGDAEVVKVLDFGISKLSVASTSLAKTDTGLVLGTPHYMSPEQARGSRDIDSRTDVYSLGASLFHLCTGRVPFDADNYNALMMSIVHDEAPDPRTIRESLAPSVVDVIRRAMARDRDQRFAGAAELGAALEALLPGSGTRSSGSRPSAPRSVESVFRRDIALAETGVAPTPFTSNGAVVARPNARSAYRMIAFGVLAFAALGATALGGWMAASRLGGSAATAPRPGPASISRPPRATPPPVPLLRADASVAPVAPSAAPVTADAGAEPSAPPVERRRRRPSRRDPDRGVL